MTTPMTTTTTTTTAAASRRAGALSRHVVSGSAPGGSEVVRLLREALSGGAGPPLFPAVRLAACRPVRSYASLVASQPLQALRGVFEDAGLPLEFGYNAGTDAISVTLLLHRADASGARRSPAAAAVWTMLGLLPPAVAAEAERELGRGWAPPGEAERAEAERAAGYTGCPPPPRAAANRCLDAFLLQTGVAISGRRVYAVGDDGAAQAHLMLEPATRGLRGVRNGLLHDDAMDLPFSYSPSYTRLGGRLPGDAPAFSARLAEEQRAAMVDDMLGDFWRAVTARRYFPGEQLRAVVSAQLRPYLEAGARGLGSVFAPDRPLGLYLHGTAGTGKSRFVRVLAESLRETVRAHVEPHKQVEIVRVPLNATTPAAFASVLRVRGITDWSVERIIEQTLTRGGLVLLHLEESPADPALQEAFHRLTAQLVASLAGRYPEFRHNVVFAFTANYEAAPSVARVAAPVPMLPPDERTQREWVTRTLEDTLRQRLGSRDLCVKLDAPPPFDADMRRLDSWRRCVAFLVATHAEDAGLAAGVSAVTVRPRGGLAPPGGVEVTYGGAAVPPLALDPLEDDRFFVVRAGRPAVHAALQRHRVPRRWHARMETGVRMLRAKFVKPAVFVLTGDRAARDAHAEALRELAREVLGGDGRLHELEADARSEDDKAALFGDPDPSRGPLFRFIAGVNDPVYKRDGHFGLVLLRVNAWGLFMLRELLEPDDSQTHVTLVRKERIMFVVSCDDDCHVSGPIESRSLCLADCRD